MSAAIAIPETFYVDPAVVPDTESIVIEDGAPVESSFQGSQQRLLVEPLYSSWAGPGEDREWLALADCGLFSSPMKPPIVPDVLFSIDTRLGDDRSKKQNNSYFVWVLGKMPDVVIEVVSATPGGEDTTKLNAYARLLVPYYVIHDPQRRLSDEGLKVYALDGSRYVRRAVPVFQELNLGLRLWTGTYEGVETEWLRWTDGTGQLILCGAEMSGVALTKLSVERTRADKETARASKADAAAERERDRAEKERARAEKERARAERLAELVRKLGGDPDVS